MDQFKLIRDMIDRNIVEKVHLDEEIDGKEYWILRNRPLKAYDTLLIIFPGFPEPAGIWSTEVLLSGNADGATMKSYIVRASQHGWGVIVLNPHQYGGQGLQMYIRQFQLVLSGLSSRSKLVLIGFSYGAIGISTIFSRYKRHWNNLLMVFLDPVEDDNFPELIKRYSTQSLTISVVAHDLRMEVENYVTLTGKTHGEIPNAAIEIVFKFLEDRLTVLANS